MNYTCPYCSRATTITDPNRYESWKKIDIQESTYGEVGFGIQCITCPNKECNKLVLIAQLNEAVRARGGEWGSSRNIKKWNLLPESEAKVLPDYIPKPIQASYYQACRIRDLSPEASATLSRRCLQGMIRDFWKISKSRLKNEVDALEEKVDPDTWESIDAVRSVGAIGAHMEQNINVIVDVEPEEAQLLIGLIEQLVDDWYVDRENRHLRAEELRRLVKNKQNAKNKAASPSLASTAKASDGDITP